ncbi:MAG: O-antigen ligase family protein [Thiotrichaceae bacterium]|nr:O-antigen ligase family protein [Thiotrichaceae bacterium]
MLDRVKQFTLFIIVFAFCSNAYLALWIMYPDIQEKYWFLLVFVVSITFFVLKPSEALNQMTPPVFLWIILFIISTVIAFIFSSQSDFVKDLVEFLTKAISLFIGIFIITSNNKILLGALYSLLAVAIFGSLMNIAEFFIADLSWSYIPSRMSGWYVNPNISGKFLVMSLIFSSIITPRKYFWPLVVLVSIGVLLTFSRTSWLGLFIAVLGLSFIRNIKPGERVNLLDIKPSSFIALFFAGLVGSVLVYFLLSGQIGEFIQGTLFESYLSQDVISRINGDFTDDSANERLQVFLSALTVGMENPLTGAGLAYTYEWQYPVGPHNDYVLLFAERGILGLISYLWLLAIIWITGSSYSRLYVAVLAFSSIATHNTFEQPATYLFIAIALLLNNSTIQELMRIKVSNKTINPIQNRQVISGISY